MTVGQPAPRASAADQCLRRHQSVQARYSVINRRHAAVPELTQTPARLFDTASAPIVLGSQAMNSLRAIQAAATRSVNSRWPAVVSLNFAEFIP
jgi:hypothetical protein